MTRIQVIFVLLLAVDLQVAVAAQAPAGVLGRVGDQSAVLHWERNTETNLAGYRVYRSLDAGGPFIAQNRGSLASPGYCDLSVNNGRTYYYRVTALTADSKESPPSATVSVVPHAFASDSEFLEYVQQTSFDYFWYGANPVNGLVPDRSSSSPCSIAAVGFGLTAIGIGIDHGWITRTQGVARVLTTLNTFLTKPQGSNACGTIGFKGWYYHFLDMNTALRYTRFNCELSSIDTALLLAGILHARQYFDGSAAEETSIRTMADAIFNRVDWNWMAQGTNAVSMGWVPGSGFLGTTWRGYDEGMILYCLGMGATNPLPADSWNRWTSGYTWSLNYGQSFVPFPPLFGHQYSHCWLDCRESADPYMASHHSSYFENSRRATLAQQAYSIANPANHVGYSSNVWGLTACDGPSGYAARGASPAQNDDGTIAPTAPAGSIAFAPEICLPTLRYLYSHFRSQIWTDYGFRDAFNLGKQWWGSDELGIDEGPIVIMIENYRTQRVWRHFMQNEVVRRGLQRAGFTPLASIAAGSQAQLSREQASLMSSATPDHSSSQVEHSPDLQAKVASRAGEALSSSHPANLTEISLRAAPEAPHTGSREPSHVSQPSLP